MVQHNPIVADRKVAALRQAMGPVIAEALADRLVVEVMVNPDGRIWIDRIGEGRSFTGKSLEPADADRILRLLADHAGEVDVAADHVGNDDGLAAELEAHGAVVLGVHAAGGFQLGRDFAADHRHRPALGDAQGLQPAHDGVAGDRVQVFERQLFQLAADAVTADRAGQRRVDVERLARDALALVLALDELQRAHVVQPVGQLHHQDAHVLGNGQDELAQVLSLARVLVRQLQARQLSHAFDQFADLLAEQLVDLGSGDRSVLDHVVQQGGDNAGGVEPVFGQDAGDFDRMGEIGIARGAQLRAMHAHAVDIGAVEQPLVGARVIALDPVNQLVLAQQLGPRRFFLCRFGRRFGWRG